MLPLVMCARVLAEKVVLDIFCRCYRGHRVYQPALQIACEVDDRALLSSGTHGMRVKR